tara:strand:+ start:668 stop:874 length:207 start_codon:yes stop_codon:yes gene_type:complete
MVLFKRNTSSDDHPKSEIGRILGLTFGDPFLDVDRLDRVLMDPDRRVPGVFGDRFEDRADPGRERRLE